MEKDTEFFSNGFAMPQKMFFKNIVEDVSLEVPLAAEILRLLQTSHILRRNTVFSINTFQIMKDSDMFNKVNLVSRFMKYFSSSCLF